MSSNTVTVYHIGPTCVQCNMTKRKFDELGIAYEQVDLREEPELTEKFKEEGLLSAPVVVTPIGTWAGFRIDEIKRLAQHEVSEHKGDSL